MDLIFFSEDLHPLSSPRHLIFAEGKWKLRFWRCWNSWNSTKHPQPPQQNELWMFGALLSATLKKHPTNQAKRPVKSINGKMRAFWLTDSDKQLLGKKQSSYVLWYLFHPFKTYDVVSWYINNAFKHLQFCFNMFSDLTQKRWIMKKALEHFNDHNRDISEHVEVYDKFLFDVVIFQWLTLKSLLPLY